MSRGINGIPLPPPALSPLLRLTELSGRHPASSGEGEWNYFFPFPNVFEIPAWEEEDFNPFNLTVQQAPTGGESRLSRDEQKTALKKLRKEIYNPAPKRILRRLNLYYREHSLQSNFLEKQKQRDGVNDDDGKSCAVCLDEFKAREEVTLTPCGHMYHEDCIIPWVKNQGRCPVCRSSFCE